MVVKDLYDPAVKQEMLARIESLTPQSPRQWGKMDVAQMLTHVQRPIACAYGTHQVKGNFLLRLIGPLFKSVLYNEKPYKQGLPTDPTYVVADQRNFETEKQQLLEMVNRFAPEAIVVTAHPIFGQLSLEQWSRATWKHLDHHLRQFGA